MTFGRPPKRSLNISCIGVFRPCKTSMMKLFRKNSKVSSPIFLQGGLEFRILLKTAGKFNFNSQEGGIKFLVQIFLWGNRGEPKFHCH